MIVVAVVFCLGAISVNKIEHNYHFVRINLNLMVQSGICLYPSAKHWPGFLHIKIKLWWLTNLRGVLWIAHDRGDRRIFLGSLDLSTDFFGYSKLMFAFFSLLHHNVFWKFLRLGNSAWDFFLGGGGGVKFWSRDFSGFWFLPPFDHPYHLKSGVPP